MRGLASAAGLALALVLAFSQAGAVRAQAVADPDCFPFAPDCERLPRLLDELSREILPFLDEFAGRADPVLRQLQEMLGDLSGWEAPEVLPNGDILIRRRRPDPEPDERTGPQPGLPDGSEGSEGSVTEPFEL